jgi:hypothetical protein
MGDGKGPEARDREREEEYEALETSLLRDDEMRGNTMRAMTFTDGAQATIIARWFSRTDQIMALANHPSMVSKRDVIREESTDTYKENPVWTQTYAHSKPLSH